MFNLILVQPLANGLILFYNLLFGNLGLSIILFSLVLRLALNPLTKPYMESMKKMKAVAPQLSKLKKKYKGDKAKLAQAQAELYKSKGIKPGAGCLPYLLQIIILIAFFNMFSRTLNSGNPTESLNALLYEPLKFASDQVVNTRFLIWDLSKPDVFRIPGVSFGLPGILLILASLAQLASALIVAPYEEKEKQVAEKTKGEMDDFQASMQKSMIVTFPLFTLFIGLKFPSGLALYWLVFSAFQVYQQYKAQGLGGLTPWINKFKIQTSKLKI